ncbi:MAG: methionine--tRNA ligase [Parcubacteria group bacterium]
MMAKSFYITTTLPYVNAEAHMGHALEFIRADVIARHKKLQGFDVFFNTGTDEHGQKLFLAAKDAGKDVRDYVDEYADKFKSLLPLLGVMEEIHFIRTTDVNHEKAAQEFWKRVEKNGYIYKKNYKAKYCVGCEAEKTESEIEDDHCIIHPHLELQTIEEENYFFKFSEFGPRLLELYEKNPQFVVPDFRLNEMKAFIERGLTDFSISRLKEKMSWGVPVPGDSDHVMYVWFDALTNYISTLGWPSDEETFNKYWRDGNPTQYCGKDNTRFQAVMWQAMLMAADLPNSYQIAVNGFVTGEGGIKMSKSLGNVVGPLDVVNEYGTDALRYFVTRELSTFEDSPFTIERFRESYNANLANGLGNLTSRIMKLAETHLPGPVDTGDQSMHSELNDALEGFEIQRAMNHIWKEIGELDREIQEKKPWETKDKETIRSLVEKLAHIGHSLLPFMPETSAKILKAIRANKLESSLFPRKD